MKKAKLKETKNALPNTKDNGAKKTASAKKSMWGGARERAGRDGIGKDRKVTTLALHPLLQEAINVAGITQRSAYINQLIANDLKDRLTGIKDHNQLLDQIKGLSFKFEAKK